MTRTKPPALDVNNLGRVVATLTRPRLSKYLRVTGNNDQQALRLYVLNAKVSAAVMIDLHYVEVALRNKFDQALTARFGAEWFKDAQFIGLLDKHSQNILLNAQKKAAKQWPKDEALPPGKIIAELTFGFWPQLTNRGLEHKLWTPCLHKAFAPRKAPKRAAFNQQLEALRQLRNRIAHHEPIFHLDLLDARKRIVEVGTLLCPATAHLLDKTSTVRREVMKLLKYRQQHGLVERGP